MKSRIIAVLARAFTLVSLSIPNSRCFTPASNRVSWLVSARPVELYQYSTTALQMEEKKSTKTLSSPLDRPALAVVDSLAILGFAAVGKASHAPDGSWDIGAVTLTAFPFWAAWLATSPLTGVYSINAVTQADGNLVQAELVTTGKGWIVAVPLGIALRGMIKGYVPPLSFIVVTMIATFVILGGARILFAFAEDFFVELVD
jgi:hypothetical protein